MKNKNAFRQTASKIIFIFVTLFFFSAFIRHHERKFISPEIFLGGESSIGDEENPYARYEWERMMLMDPATGEIPKGIREHELTFA